MNYLMNTCNIPIIPIRHSYNAKKFSLQIHITFLDIWLLDPKASDSHFAGQTPMLPKSDDLLFSSQIPFLEEKFTSYQPAFAHKLPHQEDLEKALQLDPSNSEVRQLLQQLRDQLHQERTATRQAQRQTAGFRKIFAGPALYDTEKPKPILREMKGKELRDGMDEKVT